MKNKKLITFVVSVFIFLPLYLIAKTPLALGYEISIYAMYPFLFWLVILTGSSFGVYILIHQSLRNTPNKVWLIGFVLILFYRTIVLGLPFFRGYVFYPTGDALSHIGMVKDIINTGYVGIYNIYPIVHILVKTFMDITNLDFGFTTNFLFIVWSNVYLLGIYILGVEMTSYKGQKILMVAFASPLFFSFLHALIQPFMFSLFMIPFLLYFNQKKIKNTSDTIFNNIALIVLSICITFTHPVASIFVSMILAVIYISNYVGNHVIISKKNISNAVFNYGGDYNTIFLMITTFFMWYASHDQILYSFKSIYEFLIYGGQSLFDEQLDTLTRSEIGLIATIELLINRFGPIFIYIIMALFAIVITFILIRKNIINQITYTYSVQFIFAIIFSFFSLFGFTGEFDPIRISRNYLFLIPVLCGSVFYDFIYNERFTILNPGLNLNKKTIIMIISAVIIIVNIMSFFNVFGSSRIIIPNWQVSRMELSGSKWYSTYQYRESMIASLGVGQRGLEHYNFGLESSPFELAGTRPRIDRLSISSHFGYSDYPSLADTFDNETRDILISEAGRTNILVIPEEVRSKAHQYTDDDFNLLYLDLKVIRLYSNSEFEVYEVNGGHK
jgi:hypothetical protein